MNKRKYNFWTEDEIAILKEKYPTQGCNIPELLKTRSQNSIKCMARKLAIYKDKTNKHFVKLEDW